MRRFFVSVIAVTLSMLTLASGAFPASAVVNAPALGAADKQSSGITKVWWRYGFTAYWRPSTGIGHTAIMGITVRMRRSDWYRPYRYYGYYRPYWRRWYWYRPYRHYGFGAVLIGAATAGIVVTGAAGNCQPV